MALRFIPDNTNIPFMSTRRFFLAFSFITSLICVALLFTKGVNYGVDFKGGTVIEVQSATPVANIAALRAQLAGIGQGAEVQEFGAANIALIKMGAQEQQGTSSVADQVKQTLGDAYTIRRVETVGPRVSSELITSSATAVAIGALLILIYLWFRFEWQFAVGAVLATLHDIVLTLGFYSLSGIEFNLTSVAALLTILGYSLNDTVVIYDRIREMLRRYKRKHLHEVINLSINSTLSRTVYVSFTVFLALLALVFLGGDVLYSFSSAMLIGVVVGTYSSIFVASPLLMLFNLRPETVALPNATKEA